MKLSKKENLCDVVSHFDFELKNIFLNLPDAVIENLCEIRLRKNKPVVLVFPYGCRFITKSGRVTEFLSENLFEISAEKIENIFVSMCRFSVHSLTQDIANGFVTLDSGCRIGVYGTAVVKNGTVESVRNVSGLNIRLAGDIKGIAKKGAEKIFTNGICNTLICGPPGSGKTTFLRDLCRVISDEKGNKTAVIDERGEMNGYELGVNTDVLVSYPKAKGIEIAVRTLSPQVVLCDELGQPEEAHAVINALNSGVCSVMTIHCNDYSELENKEQFRILKQSGAVEKCVFLKKDFSVACVTDSNGNNL